jgi:signal transduction histidine kinase/ligand-binding sensor domain-containing protein
MSRTHRSIAAILSLVLAFQARSGSASQETFEDFQYASFPTLGGPPGAVFNVAQDEDGFLWITGDQGLARFDGVSFVPFTALTDQPFDREQASGIIAAEGGGIWLDSAGAGARLIRDGHARAFAKEQRYVISGATFYRGPEGHVRAISDQGINEFVEGRWRLITPIEQAFQATVDADGLEWLIAQDRLLVRVSQDTAFIPVQGAPNDPWGVRVGASGRVYLKEKSAVRIFRRNGIALTEIAKPIDVETTSIIESRSGSLWIAGVHNVLLVSDEALRKAEVNHGAPAVQTFSTADGLPAGGMSKLAEDRDGNVWLGMTNALVVFRRAAFTGVRLPKLILSLASASDSQGNLWVGSGVDPVFRRSATGTWSPLESATRAVAMTRDPIRDVAWCLSENALWRLSANGDARAAPFPYPEWDAETDCLAVDASNRVVACPLGPYQSTSLNPKLWDGERWNELPAIPGRASTVAFDSDGVLWFGLSNARDVVRLQGDAFETLGPEQGMNAGPVRALTPDAGGIWLGGDKGLEYFDGKRFSALAAEGRWPLDFVTGVVVDKSGHLWVHTPDGVLRSSAPGVADALRIDPKPQRFERFGPSDGIRGVANAERGMPSLRIGGDGRLWVQTLGALAWIDPEHIRTPQMPKEPRFDLLDVQGRKLVPRARVRLEPDQRDIRIAYSSATLTRPDPVRFAYRLVGLEESWTDAGVRREATFTNLPPGRFRFEVKAVVDGGASSDRAILEIERAPAFNETWWFKWLFAIPLVAVAWLAYRLKTRALARRLKIRAEEREAIARDIHDTLLQRIQGVLLTIQSWAVDDEIPENKRDEMKEMSEETRSVLVEGRERIADLRNWHDRGLRVYDTLKAEGERLAEASGQAFEIKVAGTSRPLRADAETELEAVALEAVRNAFAHARGSCVSVSIVYETEAFWIIVVDDGQGMDPYALATAPLQGHFGMVGLRERVERLKGTIRVDSSAGEGTEIHVSVPARTAYA